MASHDNLRAAARALDELLAAIADDEPTKEQTLEIQRLVREIFDAASHITGSNGHAETL